MDAIVEDGWRAFLEREFGVMRPDDEVAVAEMVVDEPDRHDWRVVDAAYDRLTCGECGERLSRGPAGCAPCDLANGFRYVAVETPRPGTHPYNEHALRVNVSVVRRPSGIAPTEVRLRALALPVLLEGVVPTTAQAQAIRAMANKGVDLETIAAVIYEEWGRG
ncbi:hypothetical protein [Nonomuraea indica]|uniref:hypothetical protein n=1 Tax=Nonomuraea indica TaxID=1581193 RepID=UPI000C7D935B|nr:hypothetical protein [Nonomuraea indica]